MTTQAKLTVSWSRSTRSRYGDFSIDTAGFKEQFKNKDLRDAFKVGADVDAISRATISVATSLAPSAMAVAVSPGTLLTPPGNTQ